MGLGGDFFCGGEETGSGAFFTAMVCNIIGGILVVYLCGIPWLAVVTNTPIDKVIIGNLPFIFGDLVKAVIASIIAVIIKKSYPLIKV